MAGTPSSQSDNAASVTGRLQEFTGPGEPDVVFVDLDSESFGGETLGSEAPFAVRQASTTTPGVGSWLRDRYPGVELGRPMIFGAMAGLFVTVGVLAWLSFGGDDMIALDEAPASGSATADGSGGRGVFDNEGSTSNFTSSASKRLSRASGAAGKEEALAGLQARRELREQAEEAEAAAAETDGNADPDNSDPDSADPDSGDPVVAAQDPDGDGSVVDDDSDGSVDAPGSTDNDGSTSDDDNVAGPSATTGSGNTTPTSAGSPTTIRSNQTTSSVRGTASTSGSSPTSTQETTPTTPTTRATSTTPTSTAGSSQPTSSTPTSSATSTPTTAATTTSTTASTTTTTEATTTTSTTAPPPPATDLIASPASGSAHSLDGSVTFAALFTPGVAEYCWRFSSGIRGNKCFPSTTYTVSGSDFSAGSVTVTATARNGNDDVLARETITITFIGADEDPEQPEEIDDDEGGGSNPGRGGGRRPL